MQRGLGVCFCDQQLFPLGVVFDENQTLSHLLHFFTRWSVHLEAQPKTTAVVLIHCNIKKHEVNRAVQPVHFFMHDVALRTI